MDLKNISKAKKYKLYYMKISRFRGRVNKNLKIKMPP